MQLKSVIAHLEQIAPPALQESYDNAGLIVGSPSMEVTGVMLCLDSTEAVLDEAIERECNVVIAHHPIVFRGLKRLNGRNYVERVVIKAIKHNLAIYAIHTNLDNVYQRGVNAKIAEKLGLVDTRILAPKGRMKKLLVLVPADYSETVRGALVEAGAGQTDPSAARSSYANLGVLRSDGGSAAIVQLEVLFPAERQAEILAALRATHPDSSPHYNISPVDNVYTGVGSGMIGQLPEAVSEKAFLKDLKKTMNAGVVRHTALRNKKVRTIAVCGGAGGFLLPVAIRQSADVFVTADYKYHEFFDADGQIVIADIGHYESEQFTIDLLYEIISEKFSTFAAYCTKVNTNPVHYL